MVDEAEEILLEDRDEAQEAERQSCANSSVPAPACGKMDPQYRFVELLKHSDKLLTFSRNHTGSAAYSSRRLLSHEAFANECLELSSP